DGVVERRLDVGDAVGDVLPFAPARSPSAWLGLGHCSPCPLVLSGLLLPGHGLLRALTGPGVRPGALPPHGEAAAVAEAGVTADLHLPLDVLGDLPAQVALDLEVPVDPRPQPGDLFLGEVPHPGVG